MSAGAHNPSPEGSDTYVSKDSGIDGGEGNVSAITVICGRRARTPGEVEGVTFEFDVPSTAGPQRMAAGGKTSLSIVSISSKSPARSDN
jgi:hypothetical protein